MVFSKGTIASLAATTILLSAKVNIATGAELPPISDLIERAYPTWCIDENETRLYDAETCADGTPNGRFSPLYFTKQHSGADPALGGYPGNIDIHYAFEYAAPFMGQACAGSPHMCNEDFDGSSINCKKCPKINTKDDNGPYGPGHVPPHISLAAVSRAYEEGKGGDITEWFDFEYNACRILPSKLFSLIRLYYPREEDGSVYYPPPFSTLGGAYPLEFVNLAGETCTKEAEKHSTAGDLDCFENHSGDVSLFPDYLEVGHGSPHYCTKEGKAADINPDYCPYIFFGPHRGKYRHPHIAFSAVEVYLSNIIMPDKCGTKWDDSNYPADVDTTVAFPYMSDIETDTDGLETPQQPTIEDGMWIWPGPEGTKKKPVVGHFAVNLFTVEDDGNEEIDCVSVVDFVCGDDDFSILCNLMKSFGLASLMGDSMSLTMFAPTNGAFEAMTEMADGLTDEQLLFVLAFHLTNGLYTVEELECKELIEMMNGEDSRTKCEGGNKYQKGPGQMDSMLPQIVDGNFQTCSGLVHIVDHVLIPNMDE